MGNVTDNAKHAMNSVLHLFETLITSKHYPKGPKLDRKSWSGWEEYGGSTPPDHAVYILWKTGEDTPIYVGQGQLGYRLGVHFHTMNWDSVQFIVHPEISAESVEAESARKLLERFAIAVLKPKENRD